MDQTQEPTPSQKRHSHLSAGVGEGAGELAQIVIKPMTVAILMGGIRAALAVGAELSGGPRVLGPRWDRHVD